MREELAIPKVKSRGPVIDKSELAIHPGADHRKRKPQRARPGPLTSMKKNTVPQNPKHRRWIAGQPCCVPGCRHPDTQAAHVITGRHARGMKTPDEMTIPLCVEGARLHHIECDRNQQAFSEVHDMDLVALAAEYAKESPYVRT